MFNGMQVRPAVAIKMIAAGQARYVDEQTIDLTFTGLDSAVASDKGSPATRKVGCRQPVKVSVTGWDGNDPTEGCAAVMLRANDGAPASYY